MKKSNLFFMFLALQLFALLASCHTDSLPKPTEYPRIYFPERKENQTFSSDECPYTFDLPDYYVFTKKDSFFNQKTENNCWMNLACKELNATIYLSFKELTKDQSLNKLMEDTYKLTYKHSQKADFIEPKQIDNGKGAVGLIYYVGGDAASNFQFFVTDTTNYFVRGALYFYAHPNADSLKPVINFMVEDIETMINSWEWK